ncbi:MAG: hypothetical protein M3017_18145, partial [Actinomycetota bacterium]|nr:hypothetical protein [Actinomycetota bacterium]
MEEFEDRARGWDPAQERPATTAPALPAPAPAPAPAPVLPAPVPDFPLAAVVLPAVPVFDPDDPAARFPGRGARSADGVNLTVAWVRAMQTRYNAAVAAVVEIAALEARTAALKARVVADLTTVSARMGS